MDFKDFYDYRDQKDEDSFSKMNKDNQDEMNNDYKKKFYHDSILIPCLNKIAQVQKKRGFNYKEIVDQDFKLFEYKFEISLDNDDYEYGEGETYTLTVFLNDFSHNELADMELILETKLTWLTTQNIANYANHTIEDLYNEIKNLFNEMKDREGRFQSKG